MSEKEVTGYVNENALNQAKANLNANTSLAAVKEAEAIRVAMASAKWYPRSLTMVEDKVREHCGRQRFAEAAEYTYKRGGSDVSGATIKLVETIAQCYGNIESGVKELQRYVDYSDCEAFAWDLENNVKVARAFTVPHYRDTKGGKQRITDDRDIREMVFNYGSRNVRACLERVMPRDIIEFAIEECKKTLNNDKRPLKDRITDCKNKFSASFEINGTFLEKLVGEKSSNWTNSHLQQLVKYYTALKEGNCTIKDLEANFIAMVSAAQIKELAALIGTDERKVNILKAFGYAMSEIKSIPAQDFANIKQTLVDEKTETAKSADEQEPISGGEADDNKV